MYDAAVEGKVPPPALTVGDSNFEDKVPDGDPDGPQTTRRYVSVEMFAPTGPTFSADDSDTTNEISDAL